MEENLILSFYLCYLFHHLLAAVTDPPGAKKWNANKVKEI